MKEKILKKLNELSINYQNYEHNPTFTCNDAKWVDVPWKRVKTLFLRNKKPDMYYMVVLWDEKKLDSNYLRKLLGENKLSFASEERLFDMIWVRPGHVSPFALINAKNKNIKIIFDKELKDVLIWFHPWRNDNTTVLQNSWVEKFIKNLDFSFEYLQL